VSELLQGDAPKGREVAMFEMQSVLQSPVSSKRQLAAMAAFIHLSVATVLVLGLAWRIEAVEAPNIMEAFLPVAFLPAEWSAPLKAKVQTPAATPAATAPAVRQPTEILNTPPAPPDTIDSEPIATLGNPDAPAAGTGDPSAIADIGGVGQGQGIATPAGSIVWQPGAGIVAPQVLYRIDPKYPEVARAARRQGAVVVEAEIGTDGSLRSARVVSSPLGFGLEKSALDAVQSWRFAPARYGDRPVSVYYRWNIIFSLR
jgi:protein TonB